MVQQATFVSASALYHHRASLQPPSPAFSILSSGPTNLSSNNLSLKAIFRCRGHPCLTDSIATIKVKFNGFAKLKIYREDSGTKIFSSPDVDVTSRRLLIPNSNINASKLLVLLFGFGQASWLIFTQSAYAREGVEIGPVYEIGELFEAGIQLSYLLLLLGLLGVGTFYVIRQVLVRRELDLSAKELQEQVRSGDAGATELFELGAVMLRRKFYPAANKYLLQAIEKWDGDDQDLAQVYNALGVSYVRDGKIEKGIKQFETAVKLQPGYVTAWNNLGDAYEKKKEYKSALNAFEEALLFDPNNKVARPRRDALKDRVQMYKGVPVNTKER